MGDERIAACPCEFQFPFGRSRPRFNVMLWVSEKRVVSGCGGQPNGMVHLLFDNNFLQPSPYVKNFCNFAPYYVKNIKY
jgi:hypothetical protein